MLTQQQVDAWVAGYVKAWRTNASKDITALFTPKAEYHEYPYATDWIGRAQIIEGWQSRAAWQEGGWDFEWSTFSNLWTVTFDKNGKCTMFRMWNNQEPADG